MEMSKSINPPDHCRAPIGILVPLENSVAEIDFHAMAPADVRDYTSRIHGQEPESIHGSAAEHNGKKLDGVAEAPEQIAHAKPDPIAFSCTSRSFIGGATRIAAVTATTAIVSALNALGVLEVAVGTPYILPVNAKLREYLDLEGLEVEAMESIPWEETYSPLAAYRLGLSVSEPGLDAALLSCTNFRAAEIAGTLEADIRLPVVTSNQSMVWHLFGQSGLGSASKDTDSFCWSEFRRERDECGPRLVEDKKSETALADAAT